MKRGARDLRQVLVEAGVALVNEGGVEALTLRAAGAAAGVSRQAPYHHFGDKDGMLEAIAVAGFHDVTRALSSEAQRSRPPREALVALGCTYVALARAQPRMFELLGGVMFADEETYPDIAVARNEARGVLERVMATYLEGREGAPPKPVATAGAWSMAHGLARLLNEGGVRPGQDGLPPESDFVRRALEVYCDGLGRPR